MPSTEATAAGGGAKLPFGNAAGQNSLFASKPPSGESGWGNIGQQNNNVLPSISLQKNPQSIVNTTQADELPKPNIGNSQFSFGGGKPNPNPSQAFNQPKQPQFMPAPA